MLLATVLCTHLCAPWRSLVFVPCTAATPVPTVLHSPLALHLMPQGPYPVSVCAAGRWSKKHGSGGVPTDNAVQRASHSALFRGSRMQQAEGAEVMWLVGAARRAWPQATTERCKPNPAAALGRLRRTTCDNSFAASWKRTKLGKSLLIQSKYVCLNYPVWLFETRSTWLCNSDFSLSYFCHVLENTLHVQKIEVKNNVILPVPRLKKSEKSGIQDICWSIGSLWHQVVNSLVYNRRDFVFYGEYFDGLKQERRNSIANALELHLSCTDPSIHDRKVMFPQINSTWQISNKWKQCVGYVHMILA